MRNKLILFLLLTIPLATAATPIPDPGAAREQAIVESIQAENEKTREHITQFGEDTQRQYIKEREKAERRINDILTRFKFTLAITIFSAILASLEIHDLLKRRRDKKYRAITVKDAEKMQEKPPIPPPPPPPQKIERY